MSSGASNSYTSLQGRTPLSVTFAGSRLAAFFGAVGVADAAKSWVLMGVSIAGIAFTLVGIRHERK